MTLQESRHRHPPRCASRLLEWLCLPELLEEVQGDLHERYLEHAQETGEKAARRQYWLDVAGFLHPYFLRRKPNPYPKPLHSDMLRNYFNIAYRNLSRYKAFSFINILGLAVGLTCFLLIAFYVIDEATYDTFHPNASNVYRISHAMVREGGSQEPMARSGGMWGVKLKEAFPEVKRVTRFYRFGYPGYVKYGEQDKIFLEPEVLWADANYAEIFHLPLLEGNLRTALQSPQSLVINRKTAQKYFGNDNPVGKTLTYARQGMESQLVVTGVMENAPSNTHFKPDFIANHQALNPLWRRDGQDRINQWLDTFAYTYIEVNEGANVAKLDRGLATLFKRHMGADARFFKPELVPLTDIHFTPGMLYELEPSGDITYLYLFGCIALLILGIACINYMNLATARSAKRAREVGVRKVLGSGRGGLMLQFFGESLLMTLLATAATGALLTLVLPLFNDLTGKSFTMSGLLQSWLLPLLLALVAIVGLISGLYPAFYLSGFRPVEVLKGRLTTGKGAERFRQVLVVAQFSITIVLLISTAVVYNQIGLINRAKLSQQRDQVLSVRYGGIADLGKYPVFKEAVSRQPGVEAVTLATHLPRRENFSDIRARFHFPALDGSDHTWTMFTADYEFTRLFGLELVAGRSFSPRYATDSSAFLLNERAVKELDITPEKAIGLSIMDPNTERTGQVIGVMKDFHYESMRKQIAPLAISGRTNGAEILYIKLAVDELPSQLANLEDKWKQVFPGTPFEHWFLDEEFGRMYQLEQRMGKMFGYFSGLAIFIACLGLFGLASFMAEQRTKEVGIRKILGASSRQILMLLTLRFTILVGVACLVAMPIAFFFMQGWLSNFSYRTGLDWWLFGGAGLLVLLVTLLTVGVESLKAALANPINSLRHE